MYMGQVTSWMSLPPYMKTTLIRSSAWSFAVQRYPARKKTLPPLGPLLTLGTGLRQGPRRVCFLVSEVPLEYIQ